MTYGDDALVPSGKREEREETRPMEEGRERHSWGRRGGMCTINHWPACLLALAPAGNARRDGSCMRGLSGQGQLSHAGISHLPAASRSIGHTLTAGYCQHGSATAIVRETWWFVAAFAWCSDIKTGAQMDREKESSIAVLSLLPYETGYISICWVYCTDNL